MNKNHSPAAKRAAIDMQFIEPIEPSPEMTRKLFARVDADLQTRAQTNPPPYQAPPTRVQSPMWFARPRLVLFLFVILALLVVGAWILLNRFS
jgi:hypothetical protein